MEEKLQYLLEQKELPPTPYLPGKELGSKAAESIDFFPGETGSYRLEPKLSPVPRISVFMFKTPSHHQRKNTSEYCAGPVIKNFLSRKKIIVILSVSVDLCPLPSF